LIAKVQKICEIISILSLSLHIGIIIVSLHRIEGIGPPKYLDPTQKDDVTR